MPDTLGERLQCGAARLLARLPDRAKLALSGEPPIIVDGQRLDPYVQLLRSIRRRRGFTSLIEPSIAVGRKRYRRETRVFRGPMTTVGAVRDFDIPGPAGALRVRQYVPRPGAKGSDTVLSASGHTSGEQPARTGSAAPLLVYLHGGGFVIGDLETHDEPCRILCRNAEVHVLSVDYRLAPEHPFPAAFDDAQAAFAWARAHAAALGADPSRVTIGGDSAGANLAAAVALAQRAGGITTQTAFDDRSPDGQLLIYPPTDATTPRASWQLFAEGFLLTQRDRESFSRHYVQTATTRPDDPRLSPLKAVALAHAPPTLIAVAGFDILRDEGEAFARVLEEAGALVRLLRFQGLEHGFIHLTGVCPEARRAMKAIAEEWRRLIWSGG